MQLVEAGRNEPCPCGSGRKFKKCCLAARDAAVVGQATDLDVAAVVDEAIASDDWDPVHDYLDPALELFEPGAPLEHVRFRDDLITSPELDRSELARLCNPGWLSQCELEIARVLRRHQLDHATRDGLRLAAHLVRRFGARSPIVDEVATLQAAERVARVGRLASVLVANQLSIDDMSAGWPDLLDWIERERPAVLSFSEWFALRTAPDDQREALWLSSIAPYVGETALEVLEEGAPADPRPWIQLASVVLCGQAPGIGRLLAFVTPLRGATVDEQHLYDDIIGKCRHEERRGVLHRIVAATEERCEYAGAARLRTAMQMIQRGLR